MLCVNIQRLKLSRNLSSCGVCCIAFRRTSSPGEEAAPLTCRGGCPGPWAAAPFPPPGTFWHPSDNCPHFYNPGGTFTPPLHSQLEELLHKTQRGQHQLSPQVTDTASRERAWEDPEAISVNLEPKLLGSVSCKFRIYRRLCCSHQTMTFRPITFLFFAAFRFFLKWWRVQDFRNINVSLLEIAKFSTMTLWKLTVQFIDSVLRFSTNLVPELSQSYFCLIKPVHKAPVAVQAGAGLMLACQPWDSVTGFSVSWQHN